MRRMLHLNGRPRESTANSPFVPVRTGSAGGRAISLRTLTPGVPRTGSALSTGGAERPTFPARSRTEETIW